MKRLLTAVALMLVTGVLAHHALYAMARPGRTEEAQALAWLTRELNLSPEQKTAVHDIHRTRCGEIRRLGSAMTGCSPHEAGRMKGACRAVTATLIEEVCAQLNPDQRARYLHLVAPCLESR